MARTLGVLLAGGRGSRLGLDTPKALVPVAGRTLFERALATLESVCDDVVVAARPSLELPIAATRRVDDATGVRGPLAGMVAALRAREHERAIVLGVDFPLLAPATLVALIDRLGDRAAVLPAPDGIPQPLAAAYAQGAAAGFERAFASGRPSATAAALALDPLLLDDRALAALPGGAAAFFNLNTPADLERAERLLAPGGARGAA